MVGGPPNPRRPGVARCLRLGTGGGERGSPPIRGDRRRRGRAARHQQPESGVGDSREVGALGGPPARTEGGAGTRRG